MTNRKLKPNFSPRAIRDIALAFIMLKDEYQIFDFKTFARNRGGFQKADYFAILNEVKKLVTTRQKQGIARTA
jgi:hypothetical protein|tara:strand:+ start:1372 stop:1590 length:219 start_codon:yes stop_codon:yes gene_type:complete